MGYVWPSPMPRRNSNAQSGGNSHSRGGRAWMKGKKRTGKDGKPAADNAPLTPGEMHSKTRLR